MYIPKHFADIDQEEILRFIREYSFGLIVSVQNGVPQATHLPFVVSREGETVKLTSHFAKANPQWENIENQTVLVVFSEPHAYISPKHYDATQSVPTWNYIAVHAYGKARIVSEEKEVFTLLEDLIKSNEEDYFAQWATLPTDYKLKMAKGIVAFELTVSHFSATNKLSQNKKPEERQRIITSLEQDKDSTARALAAFMAGNEEKLKRKSL